MSSVDPPVVRLVALWTALTSAALVLVTLLVADVLGGLVGVATVGVVLQAGAVALWALSGAAGSASARSDGQHRWFAIAASSFLGGGLGYLALPGALGLVGLFLAREAGPASVARVLLSAVLAGAVAALAATLSPRAPAASPYGGRPDPTNGRTYR